MASMGFYQPEWGNGLNPFPSTCFKKKNRVQFIIPSISASGVGSLPPQKSSRPSLSFKEMVAEHLNETISFPSKPEWKPIQLTLYDIQKQTENPVFTWLKRAYDPSSCAYWKPSLESPGLKCANAQLVLYDGCGNIMETWGFDHIWPQSIEFAEGDMTSGDLVYCDVTLRYDRAYIVGTSANITFNTDIASYTCESTSISVSFAPSIPAEFFVER